MTPRPPISALAFPAGVARRRPAAPKPAADETGSAAAFWALIAFSGVLLISPQTYVPALSAIAPAKLAAGAALLTHVAGALSAGRPVVHWSPALRIASLLCAWSIITIPLAVWPGGAFGTLMDLFIKALIIFWLLGEVVGTVDRLKQVCWSLVIFTLPLPLTAVTRFRSGDFVASGVQGVPRIVGYEAPLTQNPNDLALMLNLILPLTLALLSITTRRLPRMLLLGAVLADVVGVLVTFSRGGLVTLAIVGAIYAVRALRRPGRGKVVALLLAGVLCLGFMPDTFWARTATIFNFDEDVTGSAQARRTQAYAALAYSLAHPLIGAGLGMNVVALADEGGTWHTVHNVWLQYSSDLGLPGLALFLMLVVASLRAAAATRRAAAGPPATPLSYLAEGIELSLAAFCVATVFHPVAYHFYFYYIAGLAMALTRMAPRTLPAPTPARPARARYAR